ncbi:GH12 family glycosyl hydrolase domain-containing protein [Paenibacillus pinistramenti]|uniref:GH12 family glycosyl hydrolase domain-containing protein n=1 Tax=Paenibacillus pinistramenti TaxID=1768003 RepID=UPI001109AB2B|nr:glycosyl hydrolase [Paenibacillus pinistramenti]
MKKRSKFAAFALTLLLGITSSVSIAFAAAWSSSDQYASWSNGGYTVYNNIWGSGAGYQSIWANSYSNWGVWAQHPDTGGIKSYPNSNKEIGVKLSALKSASSSFNVTVPTSGASFESAYDIWAGSNNAYEIMLWMNYAGGVKPISDNWSAAGDPVPAYTNVSAGGHTWNVYKGSNGSNAVYSFVRTSSTSSGTVDVLAIMNWIKGKGWFGDETLNRVQFGFEITSSPAGLNFTTNSYSVSYTKN